MQQVQYSSTGTEFLDAFRTTRAAKTLFWILLGVCILVQIAGFAIVHFTDLVDPIYAEAAVPAVTPPVEGPDATVPTEPNAAGATDANAPTDANVPAGAPVRAAGTNDDDLLLAETIDEILRWALPASRFLAMILGVLLWLSLLMAVKFSLIERLGGAGQFTSGMFWSLVLLAVVTPWQELLGGFAAGSLFTYVELLKATAAITPGWGGDAPTTLELILYYARFAAYPLLALLLWLVVQLKFRSGFRRVRQNTGPGAGMPSPRAGRPSPASPAPRPGQPTSTTPAGSPVKNGPDKMNNVVSG